MAKQEFYESWRSKILEIPGLPLEGETAASQNQSIIDGSMIPLPFKPQGDRKTNEAGNIDIHRPGHMSPFNRPGSARGHITPTPRENSLTVSIMEEEDDLLREKFKNAIKEEQTKNKKLRFDLGIPSQIIEENLGGASSNLDHSNKHISRPPYELFKVSDIFKSGFVGRGYDKRKAVSNLFKYRRGASVISPNKCQLYTPNEGVSRFQEPTEFLKCINCGLSCLNNKALEYLRGLLFYQEMINDSDVVILIGTGLGSNTLNQESRENTLNMFLQQLSTCGLKVKDIARMTGRDMKIKLYSKYLILNCPLDEKDKFEDYIEHPEMEEDLRGGMRLTTILRDTSNIEQIRKRDNSEKLLRRIHTMTMDKMPKGLRHGQRNHSLVLEESTFYSVLLSASLLENYEQLKNTLSKLEPIFQQAGIKCFGSSNNRKEAVIDKQVFFPYLFKAEKKVNIHFPSRQSSDVLFEEVNKFHDVCELNSTLVVFKQFNTLTPVEIATAFEKYEELKKHPMLKEVLMTNKSLATTLTYNFQGISPKDFGRGDQHIYKIAQPDVVDCMSKLFFRQGEVDYKITVVVLRPFVVCNSLEEIFLNVYRVNNFTILQRVYKKLENYELNYLAKLENIEPACFQNYCTMMTLGPVCVVALANYSAVQLASFLADGYRDIEASSKYSDNSPESLQSDTTILVNLMLQNRRKSSKDILEDFLSADISNSYVSLNNIINYSLSFYHDLAYDIVPNLQEEEHPADKMLNHKKVLRYFESFREFASNITFYNPNIYVPTSEISATELISIFLPDVLAKSSGLIVVHPKATEVYERLIEFLVGMGFDITWEASGFLDVDKIIELGLFYQSKGIDIKADVLDSQWSGQFFRMFRASRIAGKIELKRVFYKTCVHLTRSEISTLTRVTKENAHLLAMVCFDEVLENFFYKTIDKTSNPLDTKTITLTTNQNELLYNQVQLVNFVLAELSTHSKVISKDIISFKSKDLVYADKSIENIIALRAQTNEGIVEVRVTSATTDNLAVYEKRKKEGLFSIKTFYESVSRNYLQKAPSFSHSRIIAYEQGIDAVQTNYQKIKKLVIEVEEDLGPEFPYEIMYQIEQYLTQQRTHNFKDEIALDNRSEVINSSRLANSLAYMANKSYIENKQKGSLIAFVWGALLSTYTRKIEQTGIKLALKSGLYPDYRQDPVLGQIGFKDAIFKRDEQKHYYAILDRLKNRKDVYDTFTLKVIENKLKTIFKSEVYSLYREDEVMVFGPKFIDIENLRIFRKDKNLTLEKKEEEIYGASYNPTTGQTAPVNDMYFFTSKLQTNPHEVNFDFALQNVECGIFGKYRIHCQLDFLCEVQLPQFISLNGGFLKGCESVIPPSVLQGYRTNYKINEKDQELLVKLFNEHQQKFKAVREALDKRRKEGKPQESEDYAKYREFEDKKPLDIVNIEKFLYLFDLIDRYLNELEVMKARLDQMTNRTDNGKLGAPIQQTPQKINLARFGEVFRTAKAINLSVMRESMTDIQKASQATCFTSEALCRDRITELENMVSMLVQLLSGMELNFKGVESYLEEDSKMFIERDRYFIPLEKPNTVYDLMDERYMVDINYPSDENFFSKYKHLISFLDETRLDRQQQKWFRRVPFKVHYLKPVNKEEEGIFVENAMDEVKRKKEIEDLVQTFQYYKTIDL